MNRAARWAATHRKAIVAAVGLAVTLAAGVWGTDNKWVALAAGICTVLGVNGVPNRPQQPAAAEPAPGPHRPSYPGNPGSGDRTPPQVLWSGDMPAFTP